MKNLAISTLFRPLKSFPLVAGHRILTNFALEMWCPVFWLFDISILSSLHDGLLSICYQGW